MATLNDQQLEMCSTSKWDFSDLKALFINCTLKRSPELSHTQGLIDISAAILEKNGVSVDVLRAVDYDIAYGVWPDMTEHGWENDAWPGILEKVMESEILVLTSSIWLGEKTSVCTKVIERLYAASGAAQQRRSIRLLRSRRWLPDHRQRGWCQTLFDEYSVLTATSRLRHPTPG